MRTSIILLSLCMSLSAFAQSQISCSSADAHTTVTATPLSFTPVGRPDTHYITIKRKDLRDEFGTVYAMTLGNNLVFVNSSRDNGTDLIRLTLGKMNAENMYPRAKLALEKGSFLDRTDRVTKPLSEKHDLKCTLTETPAVSNVCTEDEDSAYNEALMNAVYSVDMDKAEQALACGADVNIVNEFGCTPLMISIGVDSLDCRSTDTAPNDSFRSWRGNYIFKLLLGEGALTHLADKSGETIAHKVVKLGKSDLIPALAKDSADLNIQDPQGMTPVMRAALNRNEKAVIALVKAEVDLTKKNILGQTAYDLGEKLNPSVRMLLVPGSDQGLIVEGGADGKCTPMKLKIVMGKPTKITLKASPNQMFLMTAKDLGIELMADAGKTATMMLTTNKMGTFRFQCGVHGGATTSGQITIVH